MLDSEASAPPPSYGVERGAGGKLRRERKPPSTPYDRPPRKNDDSDSRGGWISRIVTPAKRLISGGATRLLPSLFHSLPPPLEESPPRDGGQLEVHQETKNHNVDSSADRLVPKSTGDVGSCDAKGKSILNIVDENAQEKTLHSDGVPGIEHLIRGKTFSREEIDRLMGILQSRVADDNKEIEPSKSAQEEVERDETSFGKEKVSTDFDEESNKYKFAGSTPFTKPWPTVQSEVGASPVDIARAYMGSRKSDVGFASPSLISKSGEFSLGEFSTKTVMPSSPLQKPPICWPGAMTQDQPGYSTPQSQKRRYGLQSFPRTPYSRSIYTKTKSKLTPLLREDERLANNSCTPFQTMRTPIYGKSAINAPEDSYGTGGPIFRVRRNSTAATPARESTLLSNARPSFMAKESDTAFMIRNNLEPGTSAINNSDVINRNTHSEICVPRVHPHSSKLARQILEQLDRPITLKEKSEELRLVAFQKSSSQAASAIPLPNSSLQGTETGISKIINSGYAEPSADSQRANPNQATTDNQPSRNGQPWIFGTQAKQLNITSYPAGSAEPQNVQRRPVLPLISIQKSGPQISFASDTSTGFTFPFTTSSEPPTPSIIPSSSASPEKLKISTPLPSFTGGTKITIAPPVNATPPSSSPPTQNDGTIPKFKFSPGKNRLFFAIENEDADSVSKDNSSVPKYKFGSGQNRVNFGSVGDDAICC